MNELAAPPDTLPSIAALFDCDVDDAAITDVDLEPWWCRETQPETEIPNA